MNDSNFSPISPEQRAAIIDVWKDTLLLSDIDLDRGFADLGGTSLAANRFVARLSRELGITLPVIRVFEYPTLRLLLRYLTEGASVVVDARSRTQVAPSSTRMPSAPRANHDVAIIGMACRFPGAKNLDEFWANLLDGRDTITILSDDQLSPDVPAELRSDPRYVRAAGLIDQPFGVDAEFFAINPTEAKLTDPQQRVLLELSWHALEHAGEGVGRIPERVAVYAGTEDNSYYKTEIAPFPEAEKRAGRFAIMTGNEKDYVAMHIAHKLNLKGPVVSVHTACSTSLVAVIMACKSLRHGECDMALAGGASVHFPTPEGYYYQEGGVFSSDGHCRPFDQAAQGTNFTDGAGMVVLKRVEDAIRDKNTIYAVIKGGAINSDGGDKVSFSAPSVGGQSTCIRDALADADVDAGTIQYLEAHGTATPVGDPIEVEGLRQAFATREDKSRLQYCGLGSVKSNIGHTTAAAGVASLIKTALALRHGVIPATVHFRSPNPGLDLENSPFYIVGSKIDWPRGTPARRAGVSSFGIGGTNTHCILEEAPSVDAVPSAIERPFEIWPVSAKTTSQRDKLVASLSQERYWPRDVAFTLQQGRARFAQRGARVRLTRLQVDDLPVQPSQPAIDDPRIAFMFPGQGSQYIEMGRSLYEQLPEFRATFDVCCKVLSREMNLDFKQFIFNPANQETLENTRFTQPALFAIEVSIGRMLVDWGIEPAFMLGHSIGEFVAAHLAGVFSLEDALCMIAARGSLMAALPNGRMLSARGEISAVVAAAGEPVDIASINGPVHCVLAGDNEQIERVRARLEAAGIPCRPLHTSHAFHSVMMDPVVEPFLNVVKSFKLHAPNRTIISTATGQPMTEAQATDPMYWARHLRSTVMFSPAVLRAIDLGANVFIEVGPRTTLSSLAVQHFAKASKAAGECVAISMLADKPDAESEIGGIGIALAKLWCAGVELPWQKIWEGGRRVPLVSLYPFERKDYRFSEGRKPAHRIVAQAQEPAESHFANEEVTGTAPVALSLDERMAAELAAIFSDFSGLSIGRTEATFVECGFDSLVLMQIGVELGKRYSVSVSLRELMESQNTIARLAAHVVAKASPDRLSHLTAAPPPPKTIKPVASAGAPLSDVQTFVRVSTEPPANTVLPDAGAYLHERLSAIRDYIDLQLSQLEVPVAVPSNNLQIDVPEPAVAALLALVEAQEIPRTRPLIRRKLEQPPMPGAFRSSSADGENAWFIYDDSQRCYSRVRQ